MKVAVIVIGLCALVPASARADRAGDAADAVRGLAQVKDPAAAAYVAATALADESFGLSPSMRELLLRGSATQATALNELVVASLDADPTLRELYRRGCGHAWESVREAYLDANGRKRVGVVYAHCKPELGDTVKADYKSRLSPGAVMLAIMAEADLAVHGATTGPERKLAHYVALLALAKGKSPPPLDSKVVF